MGEGLLGPVLQIQQAVAVVSIGETDGARDNEHAGEIGGQIVVETVRNIAAQLLNELGGDLLGALRLPLHLLEALFGSSNENTDG